MNLPPTLPISFEFFPPQTPEGLTKLRSTQQDLISGLQTLTGLSASSKTPDFFSVTYGAGGSTREKTFEAVRQLSVDQPHVPVAPHLTCVGSNRSDIAPLLEQYQRDGINRLVVLRGDLPSGAMGRLAGDFPHTADLVRFIRAESGQHFHISVAAYPEMHPEAKSLHEDIHHFVEKVSAGADMAITQFFFNAESYLHFCSTAQRRGVNIPIVPGIMPINQFSQLSRFSSQCGAEIPRYLQMAMQGLDEEGQRELGLEVVTRMIHRLLAEGAPSLHFYTLNRAKLSLSLLQNVFS